MFRRNYNEIIAAMEVGTHKIAVAVAELRDDGSMSLIGVGQAPARGIRKGEVVDYHLTRQSIGEALADAQNRTECDLHEVYLGLTGAHIHSRSVRVSTTIDNDDRRVEEAHVRELNEMAQQQVTRSGEVIIHAFLQHHTVDDGMRCENPLDQVSDTLEACYHLVVGVQSRLETTVRCVMDNGVEVKGYAFNPYAAARAALPRAHKNLGAVLVDLGAGVSDYIACHENVVIHSGVLAVGSDHTTQDLSVGLKLPYPRAQFLKENHGHLDAGQFAPEETVVLEREVNFDERCVYLQSVSTIMELRMRETLERIQEDLAARGVWERIQGGVYLCGGASATPGLQELAASIFPLPVHIVEGVQMEGDQGYARRPDLVAVQGILHVARDQEIDAPRVRGWEKVRRTFADVFTSMRLF